jgi:hypothetical protein
MCYIHDIYIYDTFFYITNGVKFTGFPGGGASRHVKRRLPPVEKQQIVGPPLLYPHLSVNLKRRAWNADRPLLLILTRGTSEADPRLRFAFSIFIPSFLRRGGRGGGARLDRRKGEVGAALDPGGRWRAKMLDVQKRRVQLMLFIIGVLGLSMTGQLPRSRIFVFIFSYIQFITRFFCEVVYYPLVAEAKSYVLLFLLPRRKSLHACRQLFIGPLQHLIRRLLGSD